MIFLVIDIQTEITSISVFNSLSVRSRVRYTNYATIYSYSLALKTLKKKLSALINQYGEPKYTAIAITGLVDKEKQIMSGSAYLKEYEGKDIRKEIQAITNSPVILEQDCICDAYAELGNLAKGAEEFGLITVTYGIGGVYVKKDTDGTYSVFPTELGHTIVVPNGLECSCGQRGCVEAYIGGENLKERFLKKPDEIDDMRIWEEAVDFLAIVSANLLMCFPTKLLIYSGKSISSIPYLKNKIKEQLGKRLKMYSMPSILISRYGNKANSYGALKLIELTKQDKIRRIY